VLRGASRIMPRLPRNPKSAGSPNREAGVANAPLIVDACANIGAAVFFALVYLGAKTTPRESKRTRPTGAPAFYSAV
jgi:hypothetical protein